MRARGPDATVTYFAYGSNLCLPRLRSRVPGVLAAGPAVLEDYRLEWHKRSADGSAKCGIVAASGSVVHGALFLVPEVEKIRLDRAEGLGSGYLEIPLTVRTPAGPESAYAYIADPAWIESSLVPFRWYRDLVVAGAGAWAFPDEYVAALRAVDVIDDPDPRRAARNRAFLSGAGPPDPGKAESGGA